MNKSYELYSHQKEVIEKNPKRWGLFFECGTGKTLTAIELARQNTWNTLVVCPKSLVENWNREIDKFFDYTDQVKFKVVSKETFRRDWDILKGYGAVIFDEAHYFSGMKSQMHKSAISYLKKHNPMCIYLLTATPYMSTPFNIYALERLLGRKPNYMHYKERFFHDVHMGPRVVPVVRKGIEGDIAKIVRSIGSVVKKEDCLDLPDTVFETEYFDLTPEQERAYQEIQEDPRIGLPIVKWTKIHQVNGGTLKISDSEYREIPCEKLERLKEMAQEIPKFAVVCRYNAEIDMLKKAFIGKVATYDIRGETENKMDVVEQVNASEKCIVFINASCAEGYNLTGINVMIFYSHDFSLKNFIQIQGRIHRIGQKNKCTYIDYVVKKTIDEDVIKSLHNKKNFDIEIYAKKRTGIHK